MKKFAFIGAGSFIFTRNLVRDLLSLPAFADCELALMDTDPERLERIIAAVRKINAAMTKRRADVYHAVMMDPLCSAVCRLQEIRDMCDLIFEKNTDYLGDYK